MREWLKKLLKPTDNQPEMTVEDSEQQEMMAGVARFADETAGDVMTPRVDVVGIQAQATFPQVLKTIFSNGYSRYPIFTDKDSDEVQGVLYIKDLLPYIRESKNFQWQTLMRKPMIVPESKMIDDLLRDFQRNKVHIAFVIDEFGQMSGLVTMEDILEEIVGEINDEFDEEEKSFTRINDRQYLFQGKTELDEFYKALELDATEFEAQAGEAETLAGLVLRLLDEFPRLHQSICCNGLRFEVVGIDGRRLTKIKITKENY